MVGKSLSTKASRSLRFTYYKTNCCDCGKTGWGQLHPSLFSHTYLPNIGKTAFILLKGDFFWKEENRNDPYPECVDSMRSFSGKFTRDHVHVATGKGQERGEREGRNLTLLTSIYILHSSFLIISSSQEIAPKKWSKLRKCTLSIPLASIALTLLVSENP